MPALQQPASSVLDIAADEYTALWQRLQEVMQQREAALTEQASQLAQREQLLQQQAAKLKEFEQLLTALWRHVSQVPRLAQAQRGVEQQQLAAQLLQQLLLQCLQQHLALPVVAVMCAAQQTEQLQQQQQQQQRQQAKQASHVHQQLQADGVSNSADAQAAHTQLGATTTPTSSPCQQSSELQKLQHVKMALAQEVHQLRQLQQQLAAGLQEAKQFAAFLQASPEVQSSYSSWQQQQLQSQGRLLQDQSIQVGQPEKGVQPQPQQRHKHYQSEQDSMLKQQQQLEVQGHAQAANVLFQAPVFQVVARIQCQACGSRQLLPVPAAANAALSQKQQQQVKQKYKQKQQPHARPRPQGRQKGQILQHSGQQKRQLPDDEGLQESQPQNSKRAKKKHKQLKQQEQRQHQVQRSHSRQHQQRFHKTKEQCQEQGRDDEQHWEWRREDTSIGLGLHGDQYDSGALAAASSGAGVQQQQHQKAQRQDNQQLQVLKFKQQPQQVQDQQPQLHPVHQVDAPAASEQPDCAAHGSQNAAVPAAPSPGDDVYSPTAHARPGSSAAPKQQLVGSSCNSQQPQLEQEQRQHQLAKPGAGMAGVGSGTADVQVAGTSAAASDAGTQANQHATAAGGAAAAAAVGSIASHAALAAGAQSRRNGKPHLFKPTVPPRSMRHNTQQVQQNDEQQHAAFFTADGQPEHAQAVCQPEHAQAATTAAAAAAGGADHGEADSGMDVSGSCGNIAATPAGTSHKVRAANDMHPSSSHPFATFAISAANGSSCDGAASPVIGCSKGVFTAVLRQEQMQIAVPAAAGQRWPDQTQPDEAVVNHSNTDARQQNHQDYQQQQQQQGPSQQSWHWGRWHEQQQSNQQAPASAQPSGHWQCVHPLQLPSAVPAALPATSSAHGFQLLPKPWRVMPQSQQHVSAWPQWHQQHSAMPFAQDSSIVQWQQQAFQHQQQDTQQYQLSHLHYLQERLPNHGQPNGARQGQQQQRQQRQGQPPQQHQPAGDGAMHRPNKLPVLPAGAAAVAAARNKYSGVGRPFQSVAVPRGEDASEQELAAMVEELRQAVS